MCFPIVLFASIQQLAKKNDAYFFWTIDEQDLSQLSLKTKDIISFNSTISSCEKAAQWQHLGLRGHYNLVGLGYFTA